MSEFHARMTAPSASDKHWIHTSAGGWNSCIAINNSKWVLPNCFRGDTEILTDQGICRLDELVGQQVRVPGIDGQWHNGKVECFGDQRIWEIGFGQGEVYHATASHRWMVVSESPNTAYREVLTADLKRDHVVPYAFRKPVVFGYNYEAVRHGYMLCNAWKRSDKSRVHIPKSHVNTILPMFDAAEYVHTRDRRLPGTVILAGVPERYMMIDGSYDTEYYYNMARGAFLSNGSITLSNEYTEVKFRTRNEDTAKLFRWIFLRAGILVSTVKMREAGDYPVWGFAIRAASLTHEFFIKKAQEDVFMRGHAHCYRNAKVKYVRKTDEIVPVYCVVEPETHTFTLASGLVTGNCFAGDTKIITKDKGVTTLQAQHGNNVLVFGQDRQWHDAEVKSYGEQELFEVKIGRNEYRATADHLWPVYVGVNRTDEIKWVKSIDLAPHMRIACSTLQPVEYSDMDVAILHGYLYMTAHQDAEGRFIVADVPKADQAAILPIFEEFSSLKLKPLRSESGTLRLWDVPAEFLLAPDHKVVDQYMYNFLRGAFVARGCVPSDGGYVRINYWSEDGLNTLRDKFLSIGIQASEVNVLMTRGTPHYYLTISRQSLTENFFLDEHYREAFNKRSKNAAKRCYAYVKHVKPTGQKETVYCVEEPETHTFTLDGGVLTHNCFSGDTEFVTRYGIKTLKEMAGQEVKVLGYDNQWHTATVKHYGLASLYEVTADNITYRCTLNHRWFVQHNKRMVWRTTETLQPTDKIPFAMMDAISYATSAEWTAHGMYYTGDPADIIVGEAYSDEYVYSFLRGFFAVQGTVDNQGIPHIFHTNRDLLCKIRDLFARVKIRTRPITSNDKPKKYSYRLDISPMALTRGFFYNSQHLEKWLPHCHKIRKAHATPRDIHFTGDYADVYCVEEPETHTFVLGNGLVTGNCLSGDTEFVTDQGLLRFDEHVGETVNVFAADYTWRPAEVKCFGEQELVAVTMGNGTYKATPNHRWFIEDGSPGGKELTTKDLRPGMKVKYMFHKAVTFPEDDKAIVHGVVYGSELALPQESAGVAAYISCYKYHQICLRLADYPHTYAYDRSVTKIFNLPEAYLKLPDLAVPHEYLFNFLRGYFLQRGQSDTKTMMLEMYSESLGVAQYLRDICTILRIRTAPVYEASGRRPGSKVWVLPFARNCVDESFFLNSIDRSNFRKYECLSKGFTRIQRISPLHIVEPVYCVQEPITHTMTLANGELTGQCVGYAWGRFAEIMGQNTCRCSRANAGKWFGYTGDGYSRGTTPRLGAVACWSCPGQAGHVAIVERISSGGAVTISESGYKAQTYNPNNSSHFWTEELIRRNGGYYSRQSWMNSYVFQGFIYNPAVTAATTVGTTVTGGQASLGQSAGAFGVADTNRLQMFITEAQKHVGEDGNWSWTTSGHARGQHWCASFVTAVGKAVGGIIGVIIPNTAGAGNMPRYGVESRVKQVTFPGTWIPGPYYGSLVTLPQPGDLILFRWERYRNPPDQFFSDHVGIVVEVTSTSVITIEGNSGTGPPTTTKVVRRTWGLNHWQINGYFRPDWSKVGGTVEGLDWYVFQPLYSTKSTARDAMVREIGYVDKGQYKPSVTSSDMKLSLINYTPALGAWYAVLGSIEESKGGRLPGTNGGLVDANGNPFPSTGNSSNNVILDKVEANPRTIIQYLMGKGLSAAAAIGITANIKAESGYRPSAYTIDSNGKPSGGICQWNGSRYTAMTKYVGSNWKNNLTGQLDYLWYEITSANYSYFKRLVNSYYGTNRSLVEELNAVPNNSAGAQKAASIWVYVFERPGDMKGASARRGQTAAQLWSQIAIQM